MQKIDIAPPNSAKPTEISALLNFVEEKFWNQEY